MLPLPPAGPSFELPQSPELKNGLTILTGVLLERGCQGQEVSRGKGETSVS